MAALADLPDLEPRADFAVVADVAAVDMCVAAVAAVVAAAAVAVAVTVTVWSAAARARRSDFAMAALSRSLLHQRSALTSLIK